MIFYMNGHRYGGSRNDRPRMILRDGGRNGGGGGGGEGGREEGIYGWAAWWYLGSIFMGDNVMAGGSVVVWVFWMVCR